MIFFIVVFALGFFFSGSALLGITMAEPDTFQQWSEHKRKINNKLKLFILFGLLLGGSILLEAFLK